MARVSVLLVLLWTLLAGQAFASVADKSSQRIRRLATSHGFARRSGLFTRQAQILNATAADIQRARDVVAQAKKQAAALNKARVDKPARNNYRFSANAAVASTARRDNEASQGPSSPPPLLPITPEIAAAAALLAEVDAAATTSSASPIKRDASPFWMEAIARKGTVPWGNITGYEVFRNVRDFGAVGDGLHDDTQAIINAIYAASLATASVKARCGETCFGSTTQNALVYIPAGTYLVSSTITVLAGTQVIGDAINRPTLLAASSFVGMGVLATDDVAPGTDGESKEWYLDTGSTFRQVRNLKIDIRAAPQDAYVSAVHYQVGKATSLQFLEILAASPQDSPGTTQIGIYAENGSGGIISDVSFSGGAFGIYAGSQQFSAQRLKFQGVGTAVQSIYDWGFTWKSVEITGCTTGFRFVDGTNATSMGSVYIMDSIFSGTDTAIVVKAGTRQPENGTAGLTLDNVAFHSVKHYVYDTDGKEYVQGTPSTLDTWTLGTVYFGPPGGYRSTGYEFKTPRQQALLGSAQSGLPKQSFFERAKPQYENVDVSSFVHMKDFAKGDGTSDDTAAFQHVLSTFSTSDHVILVDSGTYILTDTVTVPTGARIVGEAWSQIVATGARFADPSNPRPLLRVGNPGDKGSVEISDLLFTTKGPTPGAILVEWNMQADELGSAGLWDTHVRVGGATGTELTAKECLAGSGLSSACVGPSLLAHISPGASAYLENVWLLSANHVLDDPDWVSKSNSIEALSVSTARGLLIESRSPSWLYGTAVDHASSYQYSISNADTLFASMIQTETGETTVPATSRRSKVQDRSGSVADGAQSLIIRDSVNVFIAGASLSSWTESKDSQILLDNSNNATIHNVVTIGASNMIEAGNDTVPAGDKVASPEGPNYSQLTVFYAIQSTGSNTCSGSADPAWHGSISDFEYFPDVSNFITWPSSGDGTYTSYVTVINASPTDFLVTSTHSYQMDVFSFSNVAAGVSWQNKMSYAHGAGKSFVDDGGEAYYTLNGPGSTFQLWARTNDGDSDSQRKLRTDYYFDNFQTKDTPKGNRVEYRGRKGDRATNLIIAGSEKYGYYDSINPPVAWMSAILDVIGERKLKHICMLGSHDAGMSEIHGSTAFVDLANTGTQGMNVGDQLTMGSRFFDIRPVVGNGGEYLTGHYNVPATIALGANGQYLSDIVSEINSFTASNPELVILHLSHAYNTDDNYRAMNDAEWSNVFDIFEGLNHRCGNLAGDITSMTINSLIGNGQACVILIADGGTVRPSSGIYSTGSSSFPWDGEGHWSNTDNVHTMVGDQLSYLQAHRVLRSSGTIDAFLVMQWIMTLQSAENVPDITSIEAFATRFAYDTLFWKAWNAFTPWSYPSVILMDFVGITVEGDHDVSSRSPELRAFVIAANLAIASKNCFVGGGTIY